MEKHNFKFYLKKNLIGFAVGAIVFSIVGVTAAITFPSNEVTYDNQTSNLKSNNVQGAIDELYYTCSDNSAPTLTLTVGNNIKGNNNWYKGLDLNISAADDRGIKETKYCVTSENQCTPSTNLVLTDGNSTYQFPSSANNQKLCVSVKDIGGNTTTK